MAPGRALLAGGFELDVACLVDGLVACGEAVCGGDVVDGGVEAFVVVVLDEGGDDTIGLFACAGCLLADGVGFEGLVPTLDLPPVWRTWTGDSRGWCGRGSCR